MEQATHRSDRCSMKSAYSAREKGGSKAISTLGGWQGSPGRWPIWEHRLGEHDAKRILYTCSPEL